MKVKNKMKPDEVTVPQWLSTNARILLTLLDEMDKDTIAAYLRYTMKIGDYLQVSDVSSVMLLDEDHRKQVKRERSQWDEIDGDKHYFFLEKEREKQRTG